MKSTATTALLAVFALSNAQQTLDSPSQDSSPAEKACSPQNSTGMPDFNAPCNALGAITYQCIYGAEYLTAALNADPYNKLRRRQSSSDDDDGTDDSDNEFPTQSNSTQRTCLCESQFFDQFRGCGACYAAHGESGLIDIAQVSSISASYCAVTATPSQGIADYLFTWVDQNYAETATASTMSDPLGNQTAISLYYTPSVTGSAAWVVAQPTSGASSGLATYASVNTVSGMIVPTASANVEAAKQTTGSGSGTAASGSGSSSSSSAGAAVVTAAGMGMLGLAGLVVVL